MRINFSFLTQFNRVGLQAFPSHSFSMIFAFIDEEHTHTTKKKQKKTINK